MRYELRAAVDSGDMRALAVNLFNLFSIAKSLDSGLPRSMMGDVVEDGYADTIAVLLAPVD